MLNTSLEKEKQEAEKWYRETDKSKLDRPIGWKNWVLVVIFSALSGLLASGIAFYYMFFLLK